MSTDDIAVGAVVRYPRTGTTGKVVKIEEIDGREYAEIDATGLYYLLDELIRTELTEVEARKKGRSLEDYMREHREIQEQLEKVWEVGTDQSCEGGG